MILDDEKRVIGGGEHQSGYTLLYGEYHGEYTQCLHDLPLYDESNNYQSRIVCQVIWDQLALIDAYSLLSNQQDNRAEEAVLQMQATLFLSPDDEFLVEANYIWQMYGTSTALERAFSTLYEALNVDEVSGDDDAFDYWPNTMDMLYQLATDLDRIATYENERADHRAKVANLPTAVLHRSCVGRPDHESMRQLLSEEWNYPERWAFPESD